MGNNCRGDFGLLPFGCRMVAGVLSSVYVELVIGDSVSQA